MECAANTKVTSLDTRVGSGVFSDELSRHKNGGSGENRDEETMEQTGKDPKHFDETAKLTSNTGDDIVKKANTIVPKNKLRSPLTCSQVNVEQLVGPFGGQESSISDKKPYKFDNCSNRGGDVNNNVQMSDEKQMLGGNTNAAVSTAEDNKSTSCFSMNEIAHQASNNNQYSAAMKGQPGPSKSGIEVDEMSSEELPEAHDDNTNGRKESSSTSVSTSSGSVDTAESKLEDNQAGSSLPRDHGKGTKKDKRDTEAGKKFGQLNPVELKILRSSLGEIVHTSDAGSPDFDDDNDGEEDHSPWSGNVPMKPRTMCSTTDSSDSIYDTEKEQDISAAEFDFASVIPMCKGTNVSFKERTHEDAQALLDQILNGQPDPCLGPDIFSIGLKSNDDARDGARTRGGVVVTVVSSDAGVGSRESSLVNEDSQEEEKNVSLHNAVGMDDGVISEGTTSGALHRNLSLVLHDCVECDDGAGGVKNGGDDRADAFDEECGASFGVKDNYGDGGGDGVRNCEKGDDLYNEGDGKDGGDVGGGNDGVNPNRGNDQYDVGDDRGVGGRDFGGNCSRIGDRDKSTGGKGNDSGRTGGNCVFIGSDGGVEGGMSRETFDSSINTNGGGHGCGGTGIDDRDKSDKDGDDGACADDHCSDTGAGDAEKDENHKGSYLESASGGSMDDSLIDSVVMENFDNGSDKADAASAATATVVSHCEGGDCRIDGKQDKGFDDGCDDKVNDMTIDYNFFCNDGLIWPKAKEKPGIEESNENPRSQDDGCGANKLSLGQWFADCNLDHVTDDQWNIFENYNVVYKDESVIKHSSAGDDISHHQEQMVVSKDNGHRNEQSCASQTKDVVAENGRVLSSTAMERQLLCNCDQLPSTMPNSGFQSSPTYVDYKQCDKQSRQCTPTEESNSFVAGAVCPCNSEVYACDIPASAKQSCSSHVTRLNGIREILKATEDFFDQSKHEEKGEVEKDSFPFSMSPAKQIKRQPLNLIQSGNHSKQTKMLASRQLQTKLKDVSRNKAPSQGPNARKWTIEKHKAVLPDITNKTKSSKNSIRDGRSAGNTSNQTTKPANLRARKSGLAVKRLDNPQINQSSRPKLPNELKSVEDPSSSGKQMNEDKQDSSENDQCPDPPLGSIMDQHQDKDRDKGLSRCFSGSPTIDKKIAEPVSNRLKTSKMSGTKKLIAPVTPSSHSPRNVNANKTNRFSRYTEILTNLDLKRSSAISCSATSSASTMASYARDAEDSLLSQNADDYDSKKGENPANRLGGGVGVRSVVASNEGGWKMPTGGRNFVPRLRRPKLESSTLYKPKRHLNPKNASAEEYHRYKMDLRLSQSLAKIKRGPPTVDCYLDPRLHNKPQTERSRSRSQKRLPEVTH